LAEGLCYLRHHDIVHGDLRDGNILLHGHRLFIADFGRSRILGTASKSYHDYFLPDRWTAPELMIPPSGDDGNPSFNSDVFAFAMVTYMIIDGHIPFATEKSLGAGLKILSAIRPPPPKDMRDATIWKLVEKCWAQDPLRRPQIDKLVDELSPLAVDVEPMLLSV
ncbi:kinase-like domain-containing protein, partial [Mycena floridula]